MSTTAMKSIAKGAGIVFIGIMISKFLGYIYRVIIARLGPEAYGEISLGLAVFGILSVISILGLELGTLRYVSIYKNINAKEKIKGTISFAMKTTLMISLILGAILFIFSDFISQTLFHTTEISLILKIISIALPFEVIRVITVNTFKAFSKIEYDVYTRIIAENVMKIILTLIFISIGLGVIGAIIAYTSSIVISTIFSLIILETKVFPFFRTKIKSICPKKEIFLYSAPLLFNSLTIIIIAWIDTLMLGFFRTTSEVGLYNAAIPTAKLIYILPTALVSLYLPTIAQYLNNRTELKKTFYLTTKWILLINLNFLFLAIIFSKSLLGILFGNEYMIASLALIILIIGYFINSMVYTSRDILMLMKKSTTILIATLTGGILNIILNYLLIPQYGIIGAAIATSISIITLSLIIFLKTKKYTKIKIINLRLIKIFLISIISAFITYYAIQKIPLQSEILIITLGVILMTSIYTIGLYFAKIFEKEDKEMLAIIKNKVFPKWN